MATTSATPLICSCGHEGSLLCKENDQPFSALYEAYSLRGFGGKSLTITSYSDMPDDLLVALEPSCPACGASGQVKFV